MKTVNRKFKIGDKVRIKSLLSYQDKIGVVQTYTTPTSDYDWEVLVEGRERSVPVWDFELESA